MRSELRAISALCEGNTHANIVKVLETGQLANSGFWFIDMELCDLSLRSFINREWPNSLENSMGYFSETPTGWPTMRTAFAIIIDITKAVEFIHNQAAFSKPDSLDQIDVVWTVQTVESFVWTIQTVPQDYSPDMAVCLVSLDSQSGSQIANFLARIKFLSLINYYTRTLAVASQVKNL